MELVPHTFPGYWSSLCCFPIGPVAATAHNHPVRDSPAGSALWTVESTLGRHGLIRVRINPPSFFDLISFTPLDCLKNRISNLSKRERESVALVAKAFDELRDLMESSWGLHQMVTCGSHIT